MSAVDATLGPRTRLSLVIPAYNEERYLGATLESVRAAAEEYRRRVGAAPEIIVVNNNSTDGTEEVARAHGARVVFEAHNNIARARNAGARAAGGEIVAFLDADDHMSSNLLWRVDEVLSAGGSIGGGARIRWDRRPPTLRIYNAFVGGLRWLFGVSTGLIYTHRETFDRLGGFDETYYATEETRFVLALKRLGEREGKRFSVIRDGYVVKSARKFAGAGLGPLKEAKFLINPKAVKDRQACAYWYERKKV